MGETIEVYHYWYYAQSIYKIHQIPDSAQIYSGQSQEGQAQKSLMWYRIPLK